MNTLRHAVSTYAVFLITVALAPAAPANAQKDRQVTRSPAELLTAFVRVYQAPGGYGDADISQVLAYPDSYQPADLEVFLQGLERLALNADSRRVRSTAVISLASVGFTSPKFGSRPSIPGMFARLERIYHRSDDPVVWGSVISGMTRVAERQQAVRFLERIAARKQGEETVRGSSSDALGALIAMGDEGRAALKRLHESGAVQDPQARFELSVLASHGYRIPSRQP